MPAMDLSELDKKHGWKLDHSQTEYDYSFNDPPPKKQLYMRKPTSLLYPSINKTLRISKKEQRAKNNALIEQIYEKVGGFNDDYYQE